MTAKLKKILCYNTYVGLHLFQSTLEIQKAVLNQLESYFGNQVQNAFVQFLIKDWTTEPDVGGGPVNYMAPGQMHNFHELRQGPLDIWTNNPPLIFFVSKEYISNKFIA